MGGKRTRSWSIVAVVALVATIALPTSSALGAGTTCSLVPTVRELMVNQGVGGYQVQARGKESLAQSFLSKPSCAGNNQNIYLTGATLTMTLGGISLAYSPLSPLSATSYATLPAYTSQAAPDPPAAPKFVIPGPNLTAAATGRLSATYSLSLSYKTTTSGTPVSRTFTTTETGTALASTVEQKTRALRVLVVPMAGQ